MMRHCLKKGSDPLRASDFKGLTTLFKGSGPFFGQCGMTRILRDKSDKLPVQNDSDGIFRNLR